MVELTRQVNESVMIGDIHVTVLDIQSNQVRLAISSNSDGACYWEETLYWEPATELRELQLN